VTGVVKVVVDVMLKPEILDPQGQAIQRALPSLGFDTVTSVRQGKRFEVEIDEADAVATVEKIAATLLANPVIEDYAVRLAD
jgi:phosphoribosylformylglycinamidine synthase